ncbi:hypothetical protein KC968_03740 [Candidatus Saccharibacteria bacterium]|nr:hypothetical protein [Candidatus Saccharibacteria bacterium]
MDPNTPSSTEQQTISEQLQQPSSIQQMAPEQQPQPVYTAPNVPDPIPPKKRYSPSKKKLILLLVLLVVIVAIAVYWFLVRNRTQQKAEPVSNVTTSTNKAGDSPKKVTFLDSAKKVNNIDIISNYSYFAGEECEGENFDQNCKPFLKKEDVEYFQIGTTQDNNGIYAVVLSAGIDTRTYIFTELSNNKYVIVGKHSDVVCPPQDDSENGNQKSCDGTAVGEMKDKAFKDNVTVDMSIEYSQLKFDESITVKGQKLKSQYSAYFLPKGTASLTSQSNGDMKVDKLEAKGDVSYYEVADKSANYSLNGIYATYKNLFGIVYALDGEISAADGKLAYQWQNGESKSSAEYFTAGRGCGRPSGYVTALNVNATDLISVGTTPGGQVLYQLPLSAPLLQELYTSDYAKGTDLSDATLKNLTIQQFNDKHAYFLVRNGLNELVVYQRSDMYIRGGCGKPVIYLYPTQETSVNVAVGADVRISEPTYPIGGWRNVLARPNGSLTYQDQGYDSLYWEGYGHGEYPEITTGTVVTSAEATSTIWRQLRQQGLNAKESQDFMDFWQPRLPKTPYMRLTWLTTDQVNRLAPLKVSPAPKTVIRVFLDFEGLEHKISLPTQKLTTPKRQGYTLVEWGGLLRKGLPQQH